MVFRVSSFGLLVSLFLFSSPAYVEAKPTIDYGEIDTGRSGLDAAMIYLASQTRALNMASNTGGLELTNEKHSLLGSHYYFQQHYNGIPVEDAEVIVSVRDADSKIYRVFKNTVPTSNLKSVDAGALVSESQAYDIAWKDLHVTGPLMSAPASKLVYISNDGQLNLVYKVRLAVSEPFGYWQYTISATSGKILKKEDTRLTRYAKKGTDVKPQSKGKILDRASAFEAYDLKQTVHALESTTDEATSTADGKALVFDPDPRTALKDNTLQDDSPAARFENAYVNRVLKDLTVSNNQYILKGPWVQIQDFESPKNVVTTTADGNWNFKRGNTGFNDAMTYFHIDQNQRYIQSLGFVGAKGIQNRSIPVDSDGVNGDDNSHFVPGENRIAFGHGCVDDNEDSDVILHEYGHAIEDAIGNWHGGDTGAMGEGFGDYWAASYSMTTVNGWDFLPNVAFNWDGAGEGAPCWPGRRLDVTEAKYDPTRTYGAHQGLGAYESDELWSTPLFQSLRELMSLGYPRDRVDQIILESHFGLGGNVSMRDMANSILQTAQKLYPNDPYAAVFQKHFVAHNIVDVPHAALELSSFELKSAGQNHVLDPGETVDLYLTLKNGGTVGAKAIRARVSSQNPNVTVVQGDYGFGDINAGAQGTNSNAIVLTLSPQSVCGDKIDLNVDFDFEGGAATSGKISVTIPTGVAKVAGGSVNHAPPLQIPDNKPAGVVSSLWLDDEGTITDPKGVSLSLEIVHTFVGDLKVTLIAPSGKEVVLHDRTASGYPNIIGTYPTTLTPAESFSKLAGELLKGEWKLKAVDDASYDKGSLKKWGLQFVSGYQCEAPNPR